MLLNFSDLRPSLTGFSIAGYVLSMILQIGDYNEISDIS